MIPVLYPADSTQWWANNGLGGLPDAINCIVTEQRNTAGGYWLEMDYPVDGLHFDLLAPERIIYAAPAMGQRPQPFRISRITRPINGIVHIEAPHISVELQKLTTFGTRLGTDIGAIGRGYFAKAREIGQSTHFDFASNITTSTAITISHPEPVPMIDVLLGAEGSILDLVGGEYEFDEFDVVLHAQRGVDSGLEIRYGVNMSDLEAETDATELVTACVPYWKGQVNEQDVVVMGDMCTAGNASAYAYVRCVPLDVSEQFDLEQDQQPTAAQVTAKGKAFINSTSRKLLQTSIRVSYEPTTSGIGERRINLCDTVRVVYPDLNVSSISKVVETKFNVLTEQYDELTIGTIRNNIVDTIAGLISGGASYSGGGSGGGGGGGSSGAVLYNVQQNLNEAQKAQARANIGAASPDDDSVFPVLTPQDFGAMGDARTDDSQAFNAALTATNPGGTVYVPDGRYILNDTVHVPEWRLLVLGGAVELLFVRMQPENGEWNPCLKVSRYGRVVGNGSLVIVPYNYTGHAVELSMTDELTNAEENQATPFYNSPGWRLSRTIEGLGVMKRRGSSISDDPGYDAAFSQTTVKDVANIGGDGIYIGVDGDFDAQGGSYGAQWMTKVDANVAGGFENGFHVELVKESGKSRWMSDTYISGAVEGAATGVLIENITGGVKCDVVVQPAATYPGNVKYAKNGIRVVGTQNVDMSGSKIWDWDSSKTLIDTLVDGEQIYRAYALMGNCRGAKIDDFAMVNSSAPFLSRIYTTPIGNQMTMTVDSAKGRLDVPPAYVFYKNFRNQSDPNYLFNRLNVAWRDPQNLVRYQMPYLPHDPSSEPNRLYQLGYFDFEDAEVPVSGYPDVLEKQTITIEEVDDRGIYGYTNLYFTENSVESRWNPIGYGTNGHIPIYYYSAYGTRRYLYKLIRDESDIQQIYNCALSITNARRFVFAYRYVGIAPNLDSSTYIPIQPHTASNPNLYLSGSVAMQNGNPMICTQSAIFGRDGLPTTNPTIKQLALTGDIQDAIDDLLYQPLSYLESDGASYIDTGVIPSADMRVVVRFKFANSSDIQSANRQYVFGSYDVDDGSVESRTQFQYGGIPQSGSNVLVGWGTGSEWSGDGTGAAYRWLNITPDTDEHMLDLDSGTFKLDGTQITKFTNTSFYAPNPLYLFACNEAGVANNFSKGLRILAVSIYKNGVRVARFLPMLRKTDGAVGMFNEDSDEFYPNDGTGTFRNEAIEPLTYSVSLNADGTVNTFDSALTYSAASASVLNGKPKKLIVTWGNSLFTADADEKLSGANGDVKFITDVEHDGIQRHMIFTLTSSDSLQTTLIETYARVPITVWEVTDVTQGLIARNTNISASLDWHLTGLNLSPFKRIKVYAKAGRKTGVTAADTSIVPAVIIEMLLDDRAKETVSQNVFIGSAVVQNPNDSNRLGMLTCAVSGDKTKFAVVRATSLYGTAATSNTDCYQYVFKIEGYYD